MQALSATVYSVKFISSEEERVLVKMQTMGGLIIFRNLTTLELNSLANLTRKGLVAYDKYIPVGPDANDVAPGYRLVRPLFPLTGGKR